MVEKPSKRPRKVRRTLSRYSRDAVSVLGQRIRIARIAGKLSANELAARVGISRDLLHRIEAGDPRCGIGVVFEAATVVGVTLFEPESSRLAERRAQQAETLNLMPKSIRKGRADVSDDF